MKDSINIEKSKLLAPYTSFGIGGKAELFCKVFTKRQLGNALQFAKNRNLSITILGGGSNVLISDNGINGLVILNFMRDVSIKDCYLRAGSGCLMGELVRATANYSTSGLEKAAGLPGTIGGAVVGNAGCFGWQIADYIERVNIVDATKLKEFSLTKDECFFDYRYSIFREQKNWIITEIGLKLEEKPFDRKEMKKILETRKRTQPKGKTAGCIFRNPADRDEPAAYFIRKCGLGGTTIGSAEISVKHPNFIINKGNATAKQIFELIKLIKTTVQNEFKVTLEEEIHYLGKF